MLTAYDFTTARILDEAGVPVILVGDSLGMTMLGYRTPSRDRRRDAPPPGRAARGRQRTARG